METKTILDIIGNTPLISLEKQTNYKIYGKAEFLNPGGSIKDRIAKYMLDKAEENGELKKGMTIIEPTSGNTGIGLALVGIQKGYDVIIVMPENMSDERKKIMKALGAKLVLTPSELSIAGCVDEACRLACGENTYMCNQFTNLNNPLVHYTTTGPEIWKQLDQKVDIFVSGLGSGGTLAGTGKFLKEKNPDLILVAVEPKNVSALLGHEPGLHKIQGIGDGFVPDVLDPSIINEIIEVSDNDAITTARMVAKKSGALVGTSSGANVWASIKMAEKFGADKVIATILADRAERYFSTSLI